MAKFRSLDVDTARTAGWDGAHKACFKVASYERGLLEDVAVLDWHLYGPGRGIAALSIPDSSRFVVAIVGLSEIDSNVEGFGDVPTTSTVDGIDASTGVVTSEVPKFNSMSGDDYVSLAQHDSVGDGDRQLQFSPPYGVIFQVLADHMNLQPSAPGDLINILMGPEPRELPDGGLLFETPVVEILNLFPPITLYWSDDFYISNDEKEILVPQVESALAQVALLSSASRANSHHVSIETRMALAATISNSSPLIPFRGFSRAAFDSDPRTLFMALYRCLENLYAYARVSELVIELELESTWVQAAEMLARRIKWRPQEESSLGDVLTLCAQEAPIQQLFDALPGDVSSAPSQANLPRSTAARLYSVRNAIVHVRPGLIGIDEEVQHWDRLCMLLSRCVAVADSSVESGKKLGDVDFSSI